MEYYTLIEKNEIMPFVAMGMHLEIIIVSEVNQRQIYDIAYMQSLIKMIQMSLFAKKYRLTDLGMNIWLLLANGEGKA